jgi:hypothetical protein
VCSNGTVSTVDTHTHTHTHTHPLYSAIRNWFEPRPRTVPRTTFVNRKPSFEEEEPFKSDWLQYLPPGLIFENLYTLQTESTYVFIWIIIYRKLTDRCLGAFAKTRKATISFVTSVSVSPCAWNNSAPPGRIFMKFCIRALFETVSRKIRFH